MEMKWVEDTQKKTDENHLLQGEIIIAHLG